MKHINNFTENRCRRFSFFLLAAVVSVGIIIGAFLRTGSYSAMLWLNRYFVPSYCGDTLYEVFSGSFLSLSVFMAAAFLLGMSAIGHPFGAAMLVYRGIEIGSSVASLYAARGARAIPTVLILVLPKAVAVIIVSVLAVRELMRSSGALFSYLISDNTHDGNKRTFRLYCIKFIVLIIISVIISIADALLNYLFSGLR